MLGMATFRQSTDTRDLSGSDLLSIVVENSSPRLRTARGTETPARGKRAPTFELAPVSGTPEIFGPYRVYELLGMGGMASVHRAELKVSGLRARPIALKRMLEHVAADPASVRAFEDEARLASRLVHDNISRTLDHGSIDDVPFIAMEMVPGPTLKQIMIQCHSAAGAMPLPIVVEILIQLCSALDYAHSLTDENGRSLGLVHRDVSPANVIVSGAGIVKLIDFGVAKAERAERTQTGVIKGKLGYMAPEYLAGRLDARADLFALGVVAHELLTGRRLFHGVNDYEIMNAVRERVIPRPSRSNPRISIALDDIVLTALARDPAQRWQSARAMKTALQGVARELGDEVCHRDIRDWTEWAFTQTPRASIEILQIVDAISDPSIEVDAPGGLELVPDGFPGSPARFARDDRSPEARTILARPSSSRVARGSAQSVALKLPAAPLRLRFAPWLVLLLMLAVSGLAAWEYYDRGSVFGREAIFDDLTTADTVR